MKTLIIAAALGLVLAGCRTKSIVTEVPVEVPVTHTETKYVDRLQRDSIYLHDSVYIDRSRDTLLIERWHTRWRDRVVRDTVALTRVDSVCVPQIIRQTQTIEVERELHWWQKLLMVAGLLAVGLSAAYIVWIFRKP